MAACESAGVTRRLSARHRPAPALPDGVVALRPQQPTPVAREALRRLLESDIYRPRRAPPSQPPLCRREQPAAQPKLRRAPQLQSHAWNHVRHAPPLPPSAERRREAAAVEVRASVSRSPPPPPARRVTYRAPPPLPASASTHGIGSTPRRTVVVPSASHAGIGVADMQAEELTPGRIASRHSAGANASAWGQCDGY